jgi:hypothetical protein
VEDQDHRVQQLLFTPSSWRTLTGSARFPAHTVPD